MFDEATLLGVCASRAWARALLGGAPYPDLDALLAASDAATAALDDAGLDEAIAGHARIGRPHAEDPRSSAEQAGVRDAGADVLARLAAGNEAYLERFGHVFLICASGRSAEEMLAELERRLGDDPETERATARAELAAINRLRLRGLYEPGGNA